MFGEIEKHYKSNYDLLVKMTVSKVVGNSIHLAEEIVQEAYANVMERKLEDIQFVNSYLIATISHLIQDVNLAERLRGMSGDKRADHGLDFHQDDVYDVHEIECDMQRSFLQLHRREVVRAISKSVPRVSKVVDLFFLKGYSHKEISNMLGIAEQTSKNIVCRFIGRFR